MEYVSIPWSRGSDRDQVEREWTVNLALWFLHILAGYNYEVDWSYKPLEEEELGEKRSIRDPRTPETPTPIGKNNSIEQTRTASDEVHTTAEVDGNIIQGDNTHSSGSETEVDERRDLELATPGKRKRSLTDADEPLHASFTKNPILAWSREPIASSPELD